MRECVRVVSDEREREGLIFSFDSMVPSDRWCFFSLFARIDCSPAMHFFPFSTPFFLLSSCSCLFLFGLFLLPGASRLISSSPVSARKNHQWNRRTCKRSDDSLKKKKNKRPPRLTFSLLLLIDLDLNSFSFFFHHYQQVARCTKIIAPNTDDAKYLINVKQIAKVRFF